MKICTKCFVEKPLASFPKRAAAPDGYRADCKDCESARHAAYYKANRERIIANAKAWAAANPEKAAEKVKKWLALNPERRREISLASAAKNKNLERDREKAREYRERYPERVRESAARHDASGKRRASRAKYQELNPGVVERRRSEYRKANPHKINANTAHRRAQKLQATPSWAEDFLIEEAYDLAQRRTAVFGFEWHVDHIVPLRGKTVCGLHVHNNLQVIPGSENCSKNNRYWPGMPGDNHKDSNGPARSSTHDLDHARQHASGNSRIQDAVD